MIKYSCQTRPKQYKHLTNKDFKPPAKDTYYWHIVNFTKDVDKFNLIYAVAQVMNEIQRAFDMITPVGPYLHLKSTENRAEADIIISFGEGRHNVFKRDGTKVDCFFPFDGQGSILAHAWSMNTSPPEGGQVHMDDSENWSNMHKLNPDGTFQTHHKTVLTHEILHVFDLDHSDVPDAVSHGAYTGIKDKLHTDDIAGLNAKLSPVKMIVYEKYYSNTIVKNEDNTERPSIADCIIGFFKKWLS